MKLHPRVSLLLIASLVSASSAHATTTFPNTQRSDFSLAWDLLSTWRGLLFSTSAFIVLMMPFSIIKYRKKILIPLLMLGLIGSGWGFFWLRAQITEARTPFEVIQRLRAKLPDERFATSLDFDEDGINDFDSLTPEDLGKASSTADANGDGVPDIEIVALKTKTQVHVDANFDGWIDFSRTTRFENTRIVEVIEESDLDGDGLVDSKTTRVPTAQGWRVIREDRIQ